MKRVVDDIAHCVRGEFNMGKANTRKPRRNSARKPSIGRWARLLCLSTIAWIMIGAGIIIGYAAEVHDNSAGMLKTNPSDLFHMIADVATISIPYVAPAESAIRHYVTLWVGVWFGVFVFDQLVVKSIRRSSN